MNLDARLMLNINFHPQSCILQKLTTHISACVRQQKTCALQKSLNMLLNPFVAISSDHPFNKCQYQHESKKFRKQVPFKNVFMLLPTSDANMNLNGRIEISIWIGKEDYISEGILFLQIAHFFCEIIHFYLLWHGPIFFLSYFLHL